MQSCVIYVAVNCSVFVVSYSVERTSVSLDTHLVVVYKTLL